MFWSIFGDIDATVKAVVFDTENEYINKESNFAPITTSAALVLLAGFNFILVVMLLNLLVALMTTIYEVVNSNVGMYSI